MKRLMFLIAAVAAGSLFAGNVCTWTGAKNNKWIEPGNWAGGVVPGVLWDGVTGTPDEPTGDTAVFGAIQTENTEIDLTGLYSIGNVTVDSGAPAYTFGSDGGQILPLEPGATLKLEAGVTGDVTVRNCSVAANLADKSKSSGVTFVNDSDCALKFGSQGNVVWRPEATKAWAMAYAYFKGTGVFDFDGPLQNMNSLSYGLYIYGGTINVNADFIGNTKISANGCSAVINIAEGKVLSFVSDTNTQGFFMYSSAKVTVNGPGKLRMYDKYNANSFSNRGANALNANTAVTINCPLEMHPSGDNWTACPEPQLMFQDSSGAFTVNSTDVSLPGPVVFGSTWCGDFCFSVPENLGGTPGFVFGSKRNDSNRAFLSYCGEGAMELEQYLSLTNDFRYGIRNSGNGILTVGSEFRADAKGENADFLFYAWPGQITYACTCKDGAAPNLTFFGWAGMTLAADAELPSKGVTLDGVKLTVEGTGRTLPPFRVVNTTSHLYLSGAVTNVIKALSIDSGANLSIFTTKGARVIVEGMTSESDVPAGLLYNGVVPRFNDNGMVVSSLTAVDVKIAARGDTVPNEPEKTVGITTAGTEGDDVLAADATEVKGLVQQAATPSVVAVGASQTLTAGEIAIDDAGAGLTVGDASAQGTVAVSRIRNDDQVSVLTVSARLSNPTLVTTGPGEVVLKGGMSSPAVGTGFAAGVTRISDGTWYADDTSATAICITNGAKVVFGRGARLLRSADEQTVASGVYTVDICGGSMEIEDGAVVSNRVSMGHFKNSQVSVLHQTGGVFYDTGAASGNLDLMSSGKGYSSGYFRLEGGTATFYKNVAIGYNTHQAMIDQTGGFMNYSGGSFRLGAGGGCNATFTMTGGTNVFSSLNIRDWGKFSSCLAVLNMDGPTANFRVSGNVQMGYENRDTGVTSTYGYLNLNAGTFQCNRLTRGVTDATHGILDREQSKMFVNFNGGTLKTAANVGYTGDSLGGLFGDCQDMVNSNWVDRVFVYEKGATIETDAADREVQIRNVLRVPYGKGVKSIAVGTIFADRKLLMPPTIKVWGVNDKGEGATARAEIDFETGAVTNIVVTSPGCGYEDGAVAYAYYGSLYNNQGEKCGEVVVADNVSGGLTKQGPGTLFLTATNTYTGATVVKEGSLKLGVDDAIDAASALILKGGTFDLANRPQTFSDITFSGGQIVNGRPTITGLTVDFAAACAGEPKAVDATQCTFAANAKLSLENFDPSGLEEGRRYLLATFTDAVTLDISEAQALIPEGWVLRLGPRSLRLVPVSGMILIVR